MSIYQFIGTNDAFNKNYFVYIWKKQKSNKASSYIFVQKKKYSGEFK